MDKIYFRHDMPLYGLFFKDLMDGYWKVSKRKNTEFGKLFIRLYSKSYNLNYNPKTLMFHERKNKRSHLFTKEKLNRTQNREQIIWIKISKKIKLMQISDECFTNRILLHISLNFFFFCYVTWCTWLASNLQFQWVSGNADMCNLTEQRPINEWHRFF